MADSSVGIKTGTDAQVSTRTNASGEHVQTVILGIDGSNAIINPDTTFGLPVQVTLDPHSKGNATATLANVAASVSSTTLIASNVNRRGAVIFNDSSAILYLKYGSTASTSSFTYQIPAQGTWEMPVVVYTGIITGIWSSATGNARTTELTA